MAKRKFEIGEPAAVESALFERFTRTAEPSEKSTSAKPDEKKKKVTRAKPQKKRSDPPNPVSADLAPTAFKRVPLNCGIPNEALEAFSVIVRQSDTTDQYIFGSALKIALENTRRRTGLPDVRLRTEPDIKSPNKTVQVSLSEQKIGLFRSTYDPLSTLSLKNCGEAIFAGEMIVALRECAERLGIDIQL